MNKELTPMQDLLQDIQETKITAIEALNDIKDQHVRQCCQIAVEKTLNCIINRIETELLTKEKQVNEYFYEQGIERGQEVSFEDYYINKFNNK